jgi:hypothetical protein
LVVAVWQTPIPSHVRAFTWVDWLVGHDADAQMVPAP